MIEIPAPSCVAFFFVGALLTDAVLEGASFVETNMLGAALDPNRLTEVQRLGTCRHQASARDNYLRLTKRWESNKYESGYEYDIINEYDQYLPAKPIEDVSLRICQSAAESAVSFNAYSPLYENILLEREYLSRAGRERKARERFDAMRERLNTGRLDAVLFTADGAYRKEWVAQMKRTAKKGDPVGPAYVDSDLMLVLMLGKGLVSEDQVDWQFALNRRLLIERNIQADYAGEFQRTNHWAAFFPKDVRRDDMPKEALGLFKEWTLNRAKVFGDEIVMRPASVVMDDEKGGTLLSFNTGYLRRTPEKISGSGSWPSHSLASQAATLAGGKENLMFAPVVTNRYGIQRLLYVLPKPFKSYELRSDQKIKGLREIVPDVEMVVSVEKIETVGDERRNVTLLHVTPKEARVNEDGNASSMKAHNLKILE